MDPQYETNTEDGVFTLRFVAPKQLLLHTEFEAMVVDECLRRAHAADLIPVGPVHIDVANSDRPIETLIEGEPMVTVDFSRLISTDTMTVIATVQIGLQL